MPTAPWRQPRPGLGLTAVAIHTPRSSPGGSRPPPAVPAWQRALPAGRPSAPSLPTGSCPSSAGTGSAPEPAAPLVLEGADPAGRASPAPKSAEPAAPSAPAPPTRSRTAGTARPECCPRPRSSRCPSGQGTLPRPPNHASPSPATRSSLARREGTTGPRGRRRSVAPERPPPLRPAPPGSAVSSPR